MRLEKHTPEEIEAAKKESGDATPTDEQLEEWIKVHDSLNKRIISDLLPKKSFLTKMPFTWAEDLTIPLLLKVH